MNLSRGIVRVLAGAGVLGALASACSAQPGQSVSEKTGETNEAVTAAFPKATVDAELEQGDWILDAAQPQDVFSEAPEELWSEVLTRKGGSYALIARMPTDPSVN